ncbi:hypothetical protein BDZ97DRAFT_1781018 [Flammula alnicola]|nr:hypothetical protein BDZ97DRAFT_1781018 [Flammula alnicola]
MFSSAVSRILIAFSGLVQAEIWSSPIWLLHTFGTGRARNLVVYLVPPMPARRFRLQLEPEARFIRLLCLLTYII